MSRHAAFATPTGDGWTRFLITGLPTAPNGGRDPNGIINTFDGEDASSSRVTPTASPGTPGNLAHDAATWHRLLQDRNGNTLRWDRPWFLRCLLYIIAGGVNADELYIGMGITGGVTSIVTDDYGFGARIRRTGGPSITGNRCRRGNRGGWVQGGTSVIQRDLIDWQFSPTPYGVQGGATGYARVQGGRSDTSAFTGESLGSLGNSPASGDPHVALVIGRRVTAAGTPALQFRGYYQVTDELGDWTPQG